MPKPVSRKLTRPLHQSPPPPLDPESDEYFDDLFVRLVAIRGSERQFYQKIIELFATSIDYMEDAEVTREFFRSVQNRFHYAVHGHSAAGLIAARAEAGRPHMGLTTWKNAPNGPVRKSDVTVAKNYLTDSELRQLYLIVDQFLSFGELQALRRRPMHMADWSRKLDELLIFNERELLPPEEEMSPQAARQQAEQQYEQYAARRRAISSRRPARR